MQSLAWAVYIELYIQNVHNTNQPILQQICLEFYLIMILKKIICYLLIQIKYIFSGKIFHNLSDISERSLNKSDCLSSENSGVFSSGTEQSPSTDQFSGRKFQSINNYLCSRVNLKNSNKVHYEKNHLTINLF